MNNYYWNSQGKSMTKLFEILEVSEVTTLATKFEVLSRNIDGLSLLKLACSYDM